MRLPLLADGSGRVDEARTRDMVAYAMQHGLNYFDTAYPYHGGESERIMGRILADYPRESYLLATKFPSHVAAAGRTPASIFEEQLEKCGVSYFDFYLLHNVCETTTPAFCDPKLGIVDYLLEQRRLGRIRYLGFSSHGQMDNLRAFLDLYGKEMAFCQIQLNYLDWTFQKAKEKYELLTSLGIPVWVMEPVRGGRLARLDESEAAALRALNPDLSPSAWALRFVKDLPNVHMVLSGMSNMEQLRENIETFSHPQPLTPAEREALLSLAERMKNTVPCTACRYCVDGCPAGLDIPMLLAAYNAFRLSASEAGRVEALPAERQPSACVACGQCVKACPQGIDVPAHLKAFAAELARRSR
ncbi:MAG: aldo/keto reductase [Clostridiales bacterium]|nr:aldo/keto reductase [Clostridiales bacterium]